ncbi:LppU/SCO3897 family protein [Williamsia herbipolensis]|uniref:LppU/SCO3897 family protein n=1 Tax=Williamsia herbipolensis TaxID=1603258 RepID=UPI0012374148|nr:hypothetical protein [Williamsia herbipolensis]
MTHPGFGPPPLGPPSPYGGYPPLPSARRRAVPPILWAALVVILGLVIAVAVFAFTNIHNRVDSTDDVAVGDCVSVRNADNDEVSVRRASCGRDEVTYYVASTSDLSRSQCPGPAYDQVSLSGDGSLCLSPNLREGRCYEIGSRSAFVDRACTAIARGSNTIVQVARRTAGDITPDCPDGSRAVGFALPRPVGYCLAPPSGTPT